jgi:hypothetical protein
MDPKNNKLNRFTTLPVLLDMLRRKRLVFSDPKYWEDKNDLELLAIYKKAKGKKSLFALCFLMEDETIHHWKAFAAGSSGCSPSCSRATGYPWLIWFLQRCRS